MGDVAEFAAGDMLLGKLRVVRKLGAGGIGAVYEVEHELTRHRRALKVLHPKLQTDGELVERFLREASAAGRIGNPHIIECFDAGRLESGAPYILMELLTGEPLSDRLARLGPLSGGAAADLLEQCADGLSAAHAAGIVHRDLKPDNLFLLSRDGRDFVKVLDFGISKFDSSLTGATGVTATGLAMGTPLYMPPEQMRGAKDVDQRSDVYALGIIVYECLSGTVPFAGESFAELAAAVFGGFPTRLEAHRPDLPTALCAAVHRAFAREQGERFQTVREFAEALAPFQSPLGRRRWGEDGQWGTSVSRTVSGEHALGATVVKTAPMPETDGLEDTTLKPAVVATPVESAAPAPAVSVSTRQVAQPRSSRTLAVVVALGAAALGAGGVLLVNTTAPRSAAVDAGTVVGLVALDAAAAVDAGAAGVPVSDPVDASVNAVDAGVEVGVARDGGAVEVRRLDAGSRAKKPRRGDSGIGVDDLEDTL